MDKWLCWAGISVGGLMLVLFLLDFILMMAGVDSFLPFGGVAGVVDIICAIAAGMLIYLSIDALRDVK